MGLQSHLEIDLGVVENQWLFEIDFQGELKTPTAPSNDCLEIENHPLTISKQKKFYLDMLTSLMLCYPLY